MRLIDAEKLPIRKADCIDESGYGASFYVVDKSDIDNAPTAYDVGKVVERLEVLLDLVNVNQRLAIMQAIEIVRRGGVRVND